ncbi:MAG: hypothetical protein AAFO87_06920, partial [Cyanobacteria bacterium J06607_6]
LDGEQASIFRVADRHQMLAIAHPQLIERLQAYRQALQQQVLTKQTQLETVGYRQYLAAQNSGGS